MITITTKNAPKQLVEKINTFIKDKRITTWDIDNENDYILNLDEYRYKAWMSIDDRIEGYTLHFCIIESRKYAMTKEIYVHLGIPKKSNFNSFKAFANWRKPSSDFVIDSKASLFLYNSFLEST